MPTLSLALYRAMLSLLHPRMLALMVVPVLVAAVLWLAAAFAFWGETVAWVSGWIQGTEALQWLQDAWPLSLVAAHGAAALVALALIPAVLVTVTLITGIFAMPVMARHVGGRSYPDLDMRRGGTFAGSAANGIASLGLFVLLAVLTLPLWLFPPLWPLLSLGLLALLNQRVFGYDALSEHASAEEIALVLRRHRGGLFAMGAVVALMSHIPFAGFFAPVYGGLAFIHYALARLRELRAGVSGNSINTRQQEVKP